MRQVLSFVLATCHCHTDSNNKQAMNDQPKSPEIKQDHLDILLSMEDLVLQALFGLNKISIFIIFQIFDDYFLNKIFLCKFKNRIKKSFKGKYTKRKIMKPMILFPRAEGSLRITLVDTGGDDLKIHEVKQRISKSRRIRDLLWI